ncbi:cell cycle checkpoint protein [Scheffersomyces coipomensis]|uniref:cell cycle checkpoint protein n=1 Tax=Scheffersomyces coipomensis TaxID=1788519 RepID=UPI00315CA2E4
MSATPVSATQRLTRSELNLFLDDIEQNINIDDNADFKKLILYLFSFTNDKLLSHAHQSTNIDSDEEKLLLKLINTIELVLSKRLHLLNVQLQYDDFKSIFQPSMMINEGNDEEDSSILSSSEPILLYEWSILFALYHIPNYHNHVNTLNQIKSFIIHIINLVTTKLHNIKYIKLLRSKLLSIVEANLNKLLLNIANDISIPNFNQKLIQTVHLFSILNDYDLSKKLSLHLINYQLKFESYSRKIWFILNEIFPNNNQDSIVQLLDNLKSIIIMNLTDNLVLHDSITWNQISIVLTWIIEYLRFDTKDFGKFTNLNKSSSYTLLKIFLLCIEKDIIENFINCHNLKSLLTKLNDTIFISNLPLIILKSLHIIRFYYNLLINEESVVNKYQTSNLNQFIITSYPDSDLEVLRLKLLNLNANPKSSDRKSYFDTNIIKRQLLDFIVSSEHKFDEENTIHNHHHKNGNQSQIISQEINCSDWISHSKDLIINNPELFDVDYTLYTFITALGNLPCILNNDYDYKINECVRCGTGPMNKNYYDIIDPNRKVFYTSPEIIILYEVIISDFLISKKRQVFENNPLLCCNLLLTIYKLFASYNPQMVSIHDERIFAFLMSLLNNNNNRDVRLLVARIFPLYLIQARMVNTDQTFKAIFQSVANIDFSNENRRHFAESTIKALSELAIVSHGERLCVIFIKLIDFFGQYNEQHVNYVYNSFLNIATAKSLAPYKLLSPYLPSIAEVIIKKPRMFARVTELLGVTKRFFLNRTREYTTPRLLEYYKYDFIQEIAEASNLSKLELVTKNLSRIIAYYLVKDETIDEKYIINVLANVSPNYKLINLRDLISKVGEVTWFILIQIDVDENNEIVNNERILKALEFVAKISLEQKGRSVESKRNYVEYHIGENVLELVQKFSENVHHIKGSKPYLEKVSSLRAIEFLININIDAITTALGQISTCLQASLEIPEFQYFALRNFHALVQKLPQQHLVSMIDIIISSIYQKFETFDKTSKDLAGKVLKGIYEEIKDKNNQYALYFLSIPFLDYLQSSDIVSGGFKKIKQISKLVIFREFTRRLKTSNEYVVQQALFDLTNYCEQYQYNCQSDYFKDAILEPCIGDLVRSILDTAAKFKNKNVKISTACAKALSIMGALDANKFKYKSIKSQIVIIQDFKDYRENSEFLVDFIENIVLKTFWASSDPVNQLFYAYAMQNFLKVLRLDFKILTPNSQDYLVNVWKNFSDIAKSTLTPLLSSKYVAPISKYEPLNFPHFKLGMKYENWLVDFTSDLLKRPLLSVFTNSDEGSKSAIFETCSRLVKDQDNSICHYLLKYVALSHISNGNESAIQNIKEEFLNILHIDSTSTSPDRVESLKSCFQTVFEVLDYLNEWVSTAAQYININHLEQTEMQTIKRNIVYVRDFIDIIPMDLIAIKSAECDSYERTILYLEKCYREGKVDASLQLDNLNFVTTLQAMYSNIDDYDELNGVLQKFSTNNLGEKLKTFQYNDNWSVAQESFQILGTTGDTQVENNTKLLKSLNEHGLHEEVLSTLAEKCDERTLSSIPLDWALVGLQSSVYSGDVQEIKKWFFIVNSIGRPQDVETLINYEFAKGVNFLFEDKTSEFTKCMDNLYKVIGNSIVPSISSSFSRNVNFMNQLHSIYDLSLITKLEHIDDAALKIQNEAILRGRLSNIDQSFDTQLQILSLHNVGNKLRSDNAKVSQILLYISSLARKNNRLDISTRSIMKAMALDYGDANTEYTKLLWAQGKQTEAIKSLSEIIKDDNFKTKEIKAEAQLQYAKWLDESNHLSSLAIISEYTKAIDLNQSSEKAYYDLGSYFNKIFQSGNDQSGYYEQQTVRNFLKSLALGSRYIFEALPKVITIWLDLAQKTDRSKEADRRIKLIIEDLGKSITTIPVYVWYTAITQILSRIVHEHTESYELMASIMYLIIKSYPRHSVWYVLSHSNSNDQVRKEKIGSILRRVMNKDNDIDRSRILFNSLIKIASHKISKQSKMRHLSLRNDFSVDNLEEPFESLVIPVRSNLEIRLPSVYARSFNAFPKSASVTFDGVDDQVNIFFSLQMPRQITVRGSDGKAYRLMLKKDDTRKDAKVGEFTTVINRLLSSSNATRKRNLQIPNYAVIPLADNLGVIEFVVDVSPIKTIIAEQRKRMGVPFNERKVFTRLDNAQKSVKHAQPKDNEPREDLLRIYDRLIKENPPVLHHWFIDQFSDPSAWYLARTNFTRSLAVMSIVGYIIGLGDRHCENILIFKKTGSVLHIDFDCLFEKGSTLPTPEIVPFRLTQNLVDAMGICGIEGSFRITCEVTGSLLRDNEAPLMNILETLLYDPLLDWKTQKPDAHLSKVRRKLRGLVNEKEGLPMNISGQVDVLIQEATSNERLCQMYGGWAPYV